jgi:hypothetical protein
MRQHREVDPRLMCREVAGRQIGFGDQTAAAGGSCGPAVLHDGHGLLVAAVVQDGLQRLDVTLGWHAVGEVAADDLSAACVDVFVDGAVGAPGRLRRVEEHSVGGRVAVEDPSEQGTVPAADVDDPAVAGEVVAPGGSLASQTKGGRVGWSAQLQRRRVLPGKLVICILCSLLVTYCVRRVGRFRIDIGRFMRFVVLLILAVRHQLAPFRLPSG